MLLHLLYLYRDRCEGQMTTANCRDETPRRPTTGNSIIKPPRPSTSPEYSSLLAHVVSKEEQEMDCRLLVQTCTFPNDHHVRHRRKLSRPNLLLQDVLVQHTVAILPSLRSPTNLLSIVTTSVYGLTNLSSHIIRALLEYESSMPSSKGFIRFHWALLLT